MRIIRTNQLIYSLLAFFLLSGCTNNKNEVILDHQTKYLLPNGLISNNVTQLDVNFYNSLINNKNETSLILYKVLKGNNFQIYLGMGFETSMEKIKTIILSNPNSIVISEQTFGADSFTIYQKTEAGQYISHYFKELESGNKYLFTAIGNNTIINESFASNFIESQITYK